MTIYVIKSPFLTKWRKWGCTLPWQWLIQMILLICLLYVKFITNCVKVEKKIMTILYTKRPCLLGWTWWGSDIWESILFFPFWCVNQDACIQTHMHALYLPPLYDIIFFLMSASGYMFVIHQFLIKSLKGACSDPQPHPLHFFQTYGDFGTRRWVIFRRLYVWSFMRKLFVVWEKSVKNPLGN